MIRLPPLAAIMTTPCVSSSSKRPKKHAAASPSTSSPSSSSSSSASVVPVPSIRLVARLASGVFVGHRWHPRAQVAQPVVVKNAGALVRDRGGKLRGPWKEWQAAKRLMFHSRQQATKPANARPMGCKNVVQVLDVYLKSSNQVYLVMEHCANGDLLEYLSRTQPEDQLSERDALDVILQVARGLHYLHTTVGIAHRDVSLENVLVARDGTVKIGDFGLTTRADMLAFGCVGKTQYVAPEVVTMTAYDPVKADMWSLGVMLFMLVTGSPLVEFAAPISPEFQAFRAVGVKGMLRAKEVEMSSESLELLSSMLEIDPRRRLASMARVLSHPAMNRSQDEQEV